MTSLVLAGLFLGASVGAESPGREGVDVSSPVVSTATAVVSDPALAPTPPLKVVHPAEGAVLPSVKSSFVFGWADPQGTLTVNGRPTPIHPGGGWLTRVPYAPGPMTLEAELLLPTTTYRILRRVTVANGAISSTPTALTPLQPDQDLLVRTGETVVVQAQAPPGGEMWFDVGDVGDRWPLVELSNNRGVYRGFYVVSGREKWENASVRFVFTPNEKRAKKKSAVAPGRVSRWNRMSPWVVEVATPTAIVRASAARGPGDKGGYILFPPVGTRLWVTGRRGREYRVALTSTRDAWIDVDAVTDAPPGTLAPHASVQGVSVEREGRHTWVRLGLGGKIPFEVRPADDGKTLDIFFYGADSNTDWIHYQSGTAVRRAEWFQEEEDVYRLRLYLRPGSWWGYDARYDNGGFVLELRGPLPNRRNPSSLKGLKIALDAGHSEESGAVGPTELLEKDANMAIALCLQKKLEASGAEVFQVRRGTESVALYDRPKRAWDARADILISIHNNALPEGADPFERNGYGVYYFHAPSFALAERTHEAYRELFGPGGTSLSKARLRDDGLHYGNLALPRTTQMPSILTESAYLILPEEESLLRNPQFQCDCAEALWRGLTRYVRDLRESK